MLRGQGDEFSDWATEELAAWARVAYRERDNVFLPMLTDGYSLEGFVIRKDGYFGPRGRVEQGRFAGADFLWAYAQAYRLTGDDIFWDMVRNIARANGLGDVGERPGAGVSLETAPEVRDHRFVHALLELFKATDDPSYLRCAEAIADTIIARGFREGWFLAGQGRSANRPEALAILRLAAVVSGREEDVPAPIA
jgi:pectate lyase